MFRKRYLVVMCPRCGALRYAESSQKTALCFGCNYHMSLDAAKIRILLKTDKREEAVKAVQKYKMNRGKTAGSQSRL